jgi:hypothetical protein
LEILIKPPSLPDDSPVPVPGMAPLPAEFPPGTILDELVNASWVVVELGEKIEAVIAS